MIKKGFHIFGIFHVVVAVSCMLIGVIVEFHQVHVYKNNISFWQLQAAKTTNKDTKKYIQPNTQLVKVLKTDFIVTESLSCPDQVRLDLSEKSIYSRYLFDLITPEYNYDKAMRGPPAG